VAAGSNSVNSYVAPSDAYSFPPLNTKYPSPSQDPKAALPSDTVTSYLPPASGGLSNTGYSYPGPSFPGYKYPGPLANGNGDKDTAASMASASPPADDDPGNDDTIGVLPASAMDNIPTKDQEGKDAGGAAPADGMDMGGGGGDGGDSGGGGGGDDSAGVLPALHNDGSQPDDDYLVPRLYITPSLNTLLLITFTIQTNHWGIHNRGCFCQHLFDLFLGSASIFYPFVLPRA